MKNDLTQEYVKSIMHYDPETGHFKYIVKVRGVKPNTVIGYLQDDGYIRLSINYEKYLAHRIAWLYMTGEWPSGDLDHKDTDKTNNRWDNLREATKTQNKANTKRICTNTSGMKGVSLNKSTNRWKATITINYKSVHLGYFNTKENAAEAYAKAAKELFTDFARIT